jgi:ubiquitin carboxyl-terminal hydrolase L3
MKLEWLKSFCLFTLQRNNQATMSSEEGATKKKKWFPLESNPELMNSYVQKLGFDTSIYSFVDVYSVESWALEMIPQPTAAVIMLYPLSDKQEAHRKDDSIVPLSDDSKVWFIKQRIGNACGTIGLLHALLNVPEGLRGASIDSKSWLGTFYDECPPALNPVTKAETLEANDTIEKLHDKATSDEANQTNRGNIDDQLTTHFIALVHVDGRLLELDGRKDGPVDHGKTSETTLLQDAAAVVQKFMSRDPDEVRFTILALAPTQE